MKSRFFDRRTLAGVFSGDSNMSETMRSSVGQIQLAWKRDLQALDHAAALRLLRAAVGGSVGEGGIRAMRRLLGQSGAGLSVDRLDDDAVIEQLASRIGSGEIVAFRQRGAGGIWSERVASEPPPAPSPPIFAPRTQTTWIEIQLLDEADQPVRGQRYEILMPDKSVQRGTLNYLGKARVDGITLGGDCLIRFPDLDADAWERIA
jgi:hypothetical protein